MNHPDIVPGLQVRTNTLATGQRIGRTLTVSSKQYDARMGRYKVFCYYFAADLTRRTAMYYPEELEIATVCPPPPHNTAPEITSAE